MSQTLKDKTTGIYSSAQAAEYLGYSLSALRTSRYTNILSGVDAPKHVKIGKKTVRYRKEDLDAWIESSVKSPN